MATAPYAVSSVFQNFENGGTKNAGKTTMDANSSWKWDTFWLLKSSSLRQFKALEFQKINSLYSV
jgi:hypothetical protein